MSKIPLSFKPTDDEEEYLQQTGKLESWTATVRTWIKLDQERYRKKIFDGVQNSLILIFTGMIAFIFSYLLLIIQMDVFVIIVLAVISAIAITYGTFSIVWELVLNVRRK